MAERHENKSMTGAIFRGVDLGEAIFDDANLYKASFKNVNLGDATIRDANLSGLTIESAAINGLTIFGIRVDELIEAELDRRDPERARLRMCDTFDPVEVKRVMERLDVVRAEFYARLRSTPAEQLNHHTGPDTWSALEHARHLLFAEDLYLNRWILRNDLPWSSLGHLPPFLEDNPAFAQVGTDPTQDLDVVLAAWDQIHTGMLDFVTQLSPDILHRDTSDVDYGQGTIGGVLQGMAQHELTHIRMAEAALRRAADIEDQ